MGRNKLREGDADLDRRCSTHVHTLVHCCSKGFLFPARHNDWQNCPLNGTWRIKAVMTAHHSSFLFTEGSQLPSWEGLHINNWTRKQLGWFLTETRSGTSSFGEMHSFQWGRKQKLVKLSIQRDTTPQAKQKETVKNTGKLWSFRRSPFLECPLRVPTPQRGNVLPF